MTYASHWEQHYAEHLNARRISGEIEYFRFEPVTFVIADRCTYTPDFLVIPADHSKPIEFHEVKGFEREDSVVKFKVAAANNPHFTFVMLTKDSKGHWTESRRIESGVACPKARKSKSKDAPVKTTKPKPVTVSEPPRISYAQMRANPELSRILDLQPHQLRELRGSRSVKEMGDLVGMEPAAWENLESGNTRLYHSRYVFAIKRIMEGGI